MFNVHLAPLCGDTTPGAGYRGGKFQHDPSCAAGAEPPLAPLVSAPAQAPHRSSSRYARKGILLAYKRVCITRVCIH